MASDKNVGSRSLSSRRRYFFDASSSTSTQSSASPEFGGVNVRVPVLSNAPMRVEVPDRGSNHQAITLAPVMTFM